MLEQLTQFIQVFSIYQWFALFLNLIGVFFIYYNRHSLLFENGSMSLGRVWSWLLFYIALSYWGRYIIGIIPPSTPFPPCLDDLIYACLFYELFKKCLDKDLLNLILVKRKFPNIDTPQKKEDTNNE